MRFSTIVALFFSSVALAAPVEIVAREAEAAAEAAPEAAPDAQGYGVRIQADLFKECTNHGQSYGTYAPPAGGYGK
jgi:hypothetical protein